MSLCKLLLAAIAVLALTPAMAGEHKHEEGDLYVFITCEDKSNLDTCTLGRIPGSCITKNESGRFVVNQEKEGCREVKRIYPPESGRILRELGYIK
jgi:hypothetical protein